MSLTGFASLRGRNDSFSLALTSKHLLDAAAPSPHLLKLNSRIPPAIDIIRGADLDLSLTATLDKIPVPGHRVYKSALASQVWDLFKAVSC